MCLISFHVFRRLLLITISLSSYSIAAPAGTFTAKCDERHFWFSVKASYLGSMVQFNIEDHTGLHVLSNQTAAECGYTVGRNHYGDLVLRASYLACYVENLRDTEFKVRVWFVNGQTDGSVIAHPFILHCSLIGPWSLREIVCEKNYMEVSINFTIPIIFQEGVTWLNLQSETLKDKTELIEAGFVIFYRPDDAKRALLPIKEAKALGYHIIATQARILLRTVYSSPYSYSLKEGKVQVEALTAIIILELNGTSVPVELSVACAGADAVIDGLHLVSSVPLILSPLVRGSFRNVGMRLGVDGRMLSDCEMKESGYYVTLENQTVEIRIPSEKANIKSRVLDGVYAQSLSMELCFMYHWEDSIWPLTQHRSFRLLHTPYVSRTPTVINFPSENMFSITMGAFPADISLQNITAGSETMTRTKAQHDLNLTQILFGNGSHAYAFQVPFSNPIVTQKVIRRQYRRYSLALIFDFIIGTEEKHYIYQTNVVFDRRESGIPTSLNGRCTERGIELILHYGSEDVQWELFVGNHRLDWQLVELGNFQIESEDDHFLMEIPFNSPGITYEEVNLKNVVVEVNISSVNMVTLKVEHSIVQRCSFPVQDILVCLPNRRILVVTDTTRSIPSTRPDSTTLLDTSCKPTATDSSRALFNFTVNSCGTTVTVEGDYLLYENEIRYMQKLYRNDSSLIQMDSPYRLTLQCRYPVDDIRTLALHSISNSTFKSYLLPQKRTKRSYWIKYFNKGPKKANTTP